MTIKLPLNSRMMEKIVGFVEWMTNGRWQIVPSDRVDELYTEIYQLEKRLAKAPTRPVRVQEPKSLEPITEQQKIMDLAG
jgi:hypothetical protein